MGRVQGQSCGRRRRDRPAGRGRQRSVRGCIGGLERGPGAVAAAPDPSPPRGALTQSCARVTRAGPQVQSVRGRLLQVLLERSCGACARVFVICSSCYRGHRYCGEPCGSEARKASVKAARKRHRTSPEGLADKRDREKVYRSKRRASHPSVVDQGSPPVDDGDTLALASGGAGTSPAADAVEVRDEVSSTARRTSSIGRCCVCGFESQYRVPPGWSFRPGGRGFRVREGVRRR